MNDDKVSMDFKQVNVKNAQLVYKIQLNGKKSQGTRCKNGRKHVLKVGYHLEH
jgi:hypothetical protein